jgi:hypothetical protein
MESDRRSATARALPTPRHRARQAWQTHALAGSGSAASLVIVGIVLAILLGHLWIGLIIALVGLIFFGSFAKGMWY